MASRWRGMYEQPGRTYDRRPLGHDAWTTDVIDLLHTVSSKFGPELAPERPRVATSEEVAGDCWASLEIPSLQFAKDAMDLGTWCCTEPHTCKVVRRTCTEEATRDVLASAVDYLYRHGVLELSETTSSNFQIISTLSRVLEIPQRHSSETLKVACDLSKDQMDFKPMWQFDDYDYLVVVDNSARMKAAERYFNLLRDRFLSDIETTVLGMDMEHTPNRGPGHPVNPPAIIQLAAQHAVFIFQLKHLQKDLHILQDILSDPNFVKCGVGVRGDVKYLRDFGYQIPENAYVDIGEKMRPFFRSPGLQGLAAAILNKQLPKDKRVQCSNWAADELSWDQVTYAATDAYVSRELALALQAMIWGL